MTNRDGNSNCRIIGHRSLLRTGFEIQPIRTVPVPCNAIVTLIHISPVVNAVGTGGQRFEEGSRNRCVAARPHQDLDCLLPFISTS